MEQLPVQQQFVVTSPPADSVQGGGSGAGGGGKEPRPPHGAEDGRSTSASDGLPSPNGIGGKPATRTEAVLERARRALQHSRTHPRVPARPLGGTDDAMTSHIVSPGFLPGASSVASTLSSGATSISLTEAPVPPLATTMPIQGSASAADPPVAVATRVLGAPYVSALGPCGSPLETLLGSQFASTAPPGTATSSQPAGTKVRAAVEHVSRAEAVLRRAKDALQRAQAPGSRTASRGQSRVQTPIVSATTSRAPTPPPAPAKATEGQRQPSPAAIEWHEATAASANASIAWSNLADHAAPPSVQLPPPDFAEQAAHLPPSVVADQADVSRAQVPPSDLADQAVAPSAQVPPSDLANQAAAPSAQVLPSNLADQAAEPAVPVQLSNSAEQVGVAATTVLPSDLTDQAPSVSVLRSSWADEAAATPAPQQLQMLMEPLQPRSEQELQSQLHESRELQSQLQLPKAPAGYVYTLTQVPNVPESAPPRRPGGKGVAPAPPPPSAPKLRGKGGPPVPKVGPPPKGPLTAEPKDGQDESTSSMSADGSSVHAPFHRKLYWKPLEIDDAEGTIFSELGRERHGKGMTFDRDALTRMFEGEKERSAVLSRRSTTMLDRVQVRTAGVKILSDHRARNIAIVLRSLSVSTKDLTRIMRQLNWEEAELSTDDLEQVLVIIPTKEEAEMLREYRGAEERRTLRDVEQMVMPFVTLSRCAARLRLMCIARSSRSQFKATDQLLASVRSCCQAIQRSALLREVMLLALDLGNYINHGDSSKGAKAIAVGSLLTLKDFKTGRMSSLHFLCATMLRMQPDLDVAEELAKELKPVVAVSKLQVQNLMASMRAFRRDTETVTLECKTYLHEYETTSAAEEEQAADGEQLDDGELEEYDASSLGEYEAIDADAARFVEDVLKIRGSANRRLQCMRRVQEKLGKYLQNKMEVVAGEVHAVLRFCGMSGAKAKEVPVEFEVLTGQLAEFIRVFRSHWDEVKADMSSYEQLFHAGGGGNVRRGGTVTRGTGSAGAPSTAARSNTWAP